MDTSNHAPWVKMFGLSEPYGKCQCGCGKDAPIAKADNAKTGRRKGEPSRFHHGHNAAVSPEKRFFNNIEKILSGCWEWQAATTPAGYGVFLVNRKLTYAHRYSYELHKGPIPDGHHVCHKCDNPTCCNPEHLFIGTDADNLRDMRNKGRAYIPPPSHGSDSKLAKIDEADVRQIREQYAHGATGRSLANEFGISPSTVSAIVRRKTWQHIE